MNNISNPIAISVIIPIYNVEEYLPICLDSVLAQSFQDFEIILVDDCSPDNSKDIVKQYKKNHDYHKQISYIKHKTNIGLGAARNTGIDAAQGDYIFFLDSDDFLHKDALKTLYTKMMKHPDIDIVMGGYKPVPDDNYNMQMLDTLSHSQYSDLDHVYPHEDIIEGSANILAKFGYMISKGGIPPAVWGRLYKRTLFAKSKFNIRFLERGYAQDLGTTPRILLHTSKVLFIKENYYYYRLRDNAATTKMTVSHKETYARDVINAISSVRDYFVSLNLYDDYRDLLTRVYYSNVGNAIFRMSFPPEIQAALFRIYHETCIAEMQHPHPLLNIDTLYTLNMEIMRYPNVSHASAKRWLWYASLSSKKKVLTLCKWILIAPLKSLKTK